MASPPTPPPRNPGESLADWQARVDAWLAAQSAAGPSTGNRPTAANVPPNGQWTGAPGQPGSTYTVANPAGGHLLYTVQQDGTLSTQASGARIGAEAGGAGTTFTRTPAANDRPEANITGHTVSRRGSEDQRFDPRTGEVWSRSTTPGYWHSTGFLQGAALVAERRDANAREAGQTLANSTGRPVAGIQPTNTQNQVVQNQVTPGTFQALANPVRPDQAPTINFPGGAPQFPWANIPGLQTEGEGRVAGRVPEQALNTLITSSYRPNGPQIASPPLGGNRPQVEAGVRTPGVPNEYVFAGRGAGPATVGAETRFPSLNYTTSPDFQSWLGGQGGFRAEAVPFNVGAGGSSLLTLSGPQTAEIRGAPGSGTGFGFNPTMFAGTFGRDFSGLNPMQQAVASLALMGAQNNLIAAGASPQAALQVLTRPDQGAISSGQPGLYGNYTTLPQAAYDPNAAGGYDFNYGGDLQGAEPYAQGTDQGGIMVGTPAKAPVFGPVGPTVPNGLLDVNIASQWPWIQWFPLPPRPRGYAMGTNGVPLGGRPDQVIPAPVGLVNLRTGRMEAITGEQGPERIDVTPVRGYAKGTGVTDYLNTQPRMSTPATIAGIPTPPPDAATVPEPTNPPPTTTPPATTIPPTITPPPTTAPPSTPTAYTPFPPPVGPPAEFNPEDPNVILPWQVAAQKLALQNAARDRLGYRYAAAGLKGPSGVPILAGEIPSQQLGPGQFFDLRPQVNDVIGQIQNNLADLKTYGPAEDLNPIYGRIGEIGTGLKNIERISNLQNDKVGLAAKWQAEYNANQGLVSALVPQIAQVQQNIAQLQATINGGGSVPAGAMETLQNQLQNLQNLTLQAQNWIITNPVAPTAAIDAEINNLTDQLGGANEAQLRTELAQLNTRLSNQNKRTQTIQTLYNLSKVGVPSLSAPLAA